MENREPLSVSVLAEVFVALSYDYRRRTKHELFVVEIRTTSLITVLKDLSDLADQANHLFDFAAHIGALVAAVLAGTIALRSRRRLGSGTVLALAEAAMRGNAEVKITHRNRSGDQLLVHITPEQALRIQHASKVPPELPSRDEPPSELDRLESLAKQVALNHPEGMVLPYASSPEMASLLRELVEIIKEQPEGRRKLAEVSHRLRSQGHHAAASLLEP